MKRMVSLLLCIIIHDVSCSEPYNKSILQKSKLYNKAAFQKIADGYVVVFQNKKGEIKKIKKIENKKLQEKYKQYLVGVESEELIVPDQQWNPLFLSQPWRQVLYSGFNANTIIHRYLTTTHSVYLFQERKKNFAGATKVSELNTHNSPIETIAEINWNNGQYLLSSSLYPSIKMYNVSSRREVKCNGNQSYLLGAHNTSILYASVIEQRSMFARWANRKSINKCRVYVKNISKLSRHINYKDKPALEKQVFNFKQDETSKEKVMDEKNNHLTLTIGPGSIPLVAFSKVTLEVQKKQKIFLLPWAVLYDTSMKDIYFIDLHGKTFFKHTLTDEANYLSIAVDVNDSFVEAYLLLEDSKTIKVVRLNKANKLEKEEKLFNLARFNTKVIAIAFYGNNLLCATSDGQVKIVDIKKVKEQQVVKIEQGEDNSLLIKTTYEKVIRKN